jgi:hypothetical protein
MTVKEAVEVEKDKSVGKITTDMLSGRQPGGKLNSFKNFKVNLTVSGEEDIPKEIDQGEDTKEKQKISTNPGAVDIKLDDKLTGPTPYTHFSTQDSITSGKKVTEDVRGVRGELKHIRSKESEEHNKEIGKFSKKVVEDKEEDTGKWREETPWKKVPANVKGKSGATHTASMRLAQALAKSSFKKIKKDTM